MLRLGSGRLRSGRFWRSGLGWGRCASLDRIGLIVKADDVLGDVDLRGSEENRRVLPGGIQDNDETVFAGEALEHVDHLAADAFGNIAERGVGVFLVFGVHALKALLEALALRPQPATLFRTPFP